MQSEHDLGRTRAQKALMARLRRRGKWAFVKSLPAGARVLDVGCGNNSPWDFKALRPDVHYTGLDIGDYNQQAPTTLADAYVITTPQDFAARIGDYAGSMTAVVSSHNLEHCNDQPAVLHAMAAALCPGGGLYLAFPCEASVRFPRRRGTLNFFDDASHRAVPRWEATLSELRRHGLQIDFMAQRYRPLLLASLGLLLEPAAAMMKANMPGGVGWALYGFESVIWARRPS